MNKERWNSDQISCLNSEECQYLNEIDDLIKQTNKIFKDLNDIERFTHYDIKCNKEKIMIDFSEIKTKLTETQKLIDDL